MTLISCRRNCPKSGRRSSAPPLTALESKRWCTWTIRTVPFRHTLDLRRDIVRQIRKYRPHIVITMDPTRRWLGQGYINHPDHVATSDATLAAVFPAARDYWNFHELIGEGLMPHKVAELYLYAAEAADVWIEHRRHDRGQDRRVEGASEPGWRLRRGRGYSELGAKHGGRQRHGIRRVIQDFQPRLKSRNRQWLDKAK